MFVAKGMQCSQLAYIYMYNTTHIRMVYIYLLFHTYPQFANNQKEKKKLFVAYQME